MSSISEIQARIHAIHQQVMQPAVPGGIGALLASHVTAGVADPGPTAASTAPVSEEVHFVVAPQAQMATVRGLRSFAAQGVTLGMMLGITPTSSRLRMPETIAGSAELTEYLRVHGIETRNGRLDVNELTAVSGGWNGSAYLLQPAAVAWEEMRAAAPST